MDNQLQHYLILSKCWQNQQKIEQQHLAPVDPKRPKRHIASTLMSHTGKLMVYMGQYLQTIAQPAPKAKRANI